MQFHYLLPIYLKLHKSLLDLIFIAIPCDIFRVCGVSMSSDYKTITASYEDSSIRLWKLVPGVFKSEQTPVNISHINLSCDYTEDIQERHVYV